MLYKSISDFNVFSIGFIVGSSEKESHYCSAFSYLLCERRIWRRLNSEVVLVKNMQVGSIAPLILKLCYIQM
jgi:hypothetical protein